MVDLAGYETSAVYERRIFETGTARLDPSITSILTSILTSVTRHEPQIYPPSGHILIMGWYHCGPELTVRYLD